MRSLLLLITLFSLSVAFARTEPSVAAKKQFCQQRLSSIDGLQQIVAQRDNQLWFENQGGLLGGGVCWWHSRFTRAAAYLALFDPSLPKASAEEAKDIILNIRNRKRVVTVPGYRNLYEFSVDYGDEILGKLQDWQRSDALFKAAWFKGAIREIDIPAEKLSNMMDQLYERVSRGEVVYQMLQMPGIMAHSWLVVGMEKTSSGYEIETVDSNVPGGSSLYKYSRDMKRLDYSYLTTFVPYIAQTGEEANLRDKLTDECE
jgi:hypothetical protein